MKQMLRDVVGSEEAPAELAAAVRDRVRTERRSFFDVDAARWMMAVAAVLVLAIGSVAALHWGRLIGIGGNSRALQAVSARVQEILRVGLVDHLHCAIQSEQWKRSETLEEMRAKTGRSALGLEFIDLVPAVQAKIGPEFKVVEGHRCMANQRRYIHLILTGKNGAILSVVITEKKDNESFTKADAVAVMKASGVPIYRDYQGTSEIAGFESDKYLAYVVSNLDKNMNLEVASTLAPVVYGHLHRLES
jgi:hypothetical protein